ncbi:MAG: PAS domain S-box protein [Myxococcota bacterium]|jgi:PAS domain S-box-containing protein
MVNARDDVVGNMAGSVIARIPAPTPGLKLPVLPERTDRLLTLLSSMDAYVTEADSAPRTLFVSPGVSEVTGYSPEEVIAGDCLVIHEDDHHLLANGAIALAKYGRAFSCIIRMKHKRGDWLWIEISSLSSYETSEGGYRSMSLNRDVTRLMNTQRDLAQSEERYRAVSEMTRDLITESTTDSQTVYVSPGVSEALGWSREELAAHGPYEKVHPDDVERVRRVTEESLASGQPSHYEAFRIFAKNGQCLWFETSAMIYQRSDGETRILSVSHNITEQRREQEDRRELEEQMVRAQKLESLGVMAGGIAHDFNNLLTPILGEASLVLEDLPQDSPLRERMLKIRHAAERAASLTNQMLSYAGRGPVHLERLDLSQLVDEMGRLFESAVSGKTVLDFDLTPAMLLIEADSSQISQVVMNLITNASESLPDGEGKITVRTGGVDLLAPPNKSVFAERLEAGPHIYVEVSDTGCGMDADTITKIFDPFFTTKFTGRGLGLAAVAGIVRGHQGALEIRSEPGKGSVVRVLFPVSQGAEPLGQLTSIGGKNTWTADAMVLVIDDDEGMRDLATDILSRAGLEVRAAANGRDGLEIFRAHANEINLVLLDRTMPTMSGYETFQEIRKIHPSTPVVLVSGYSEERAAAELAGAGLAGFLHKPFLPETLLDLVKASIEG